MMRPSTLDIKTNYHDGYYTFMRDTYRCWKSRMESCEKTGIEDYLADLQQSFSKKQVRDILFTLNVTRANGTKCPSAPILQQPTGALSPSSQYCQQSQQHQTGPAVQSNDHSRHPVERLTFGEFTAIASCTKCFGRQSSFYAIRALNEAKASADDQPAEADTEKKGPEVFLGGSCNPTTWRADVAVPTLQRLGITFYNPQVSHWTPDLIDLEHRAKEKAKVLFFVLDSQTRSTAGAIEVAHIAGQNSKFLLLVLLPYSIRQKILNETLSEDEYMDLMSNQLILRQLVLRRGLPVLDNVSTALEQITKLQHGSCSLQPPNNLASRLLSLYRTYQRIAAEVAGAEGIDIVQCKKALYSLGYPKNVVTEDDIQNILLCYEEIADRTVQSELIRTGHAEEVLISFDEFCIIDACVSILMLDFYEQNCLSPIKGTNLQQPPVYLTDLQAWNQTNSEHAPISPGILHQESSSRRYVLRPYQEEPTVVENGKRDADSPPDPFGCGNTAARTVCQSSSGSELSGNTNGSPAPTIAVPRAFTFDGGLFDDDEPSLGRIEARDVYLGGSCWMKTSWRQRWAFPMLKQHNLSYYVSALHEGFCCSRPAVTCDESGQQYDPQRTLRYDAAMLDACRIIIFAITNETRSLAPMTMAAHYIGLGYDVVLCVQMLSSNESSPHGHHPTLSSSAIKDYNRGRAYLIDLAKRHHIPVFDGLEETFESVINRLNNCTVRYSS
uniref:Raw n=1 Tax=Anopheles atroparvus TaxID=41427 RepID=A0A182JD10_ANOAO